MFFALKVFCIEKSAVILHGYRLQSFLFIHTIAFQSALHDNSNIWADAGPLKEKLLGTRWKIKT